MEIPEDAIPGFKIVSDIVVGIHNHFKKNKFGTIVSIADSLGFTPHVLEYHITKLSTGPNPVLAFTYKTVINDTTNRKVRTKVYYKIERV